MPNNIMVTLTVDDALYSKIEEHAELNTISKAELVRRALRAYFEILEMPLQEGR